MLGDTQQSLPDDLDEHDQYVYAGIVVGCLVLFLLPQPIQLVGSAWLVGVWFTTAWRARARHDAETKD